MRTEVPCCDPGTVQMRSKCAPDEGDRTGRSTRAPRSWTGVPVSICAVMGAGGSASGTMRAARNTPPVAEVASQTPKNSRPSEATANPRGASLAGNPHPPQGAFCPAESGQPFGLRPALVVPPVHQRRIVCADHGGILLFDAGPVRKDRRDVIDCARVALQCFGPHFDCWSRRICPAVVPSRAMPAGRRLGRLLDRELVQELLDVFRNGHRNEP